MSDPNSMDAPKGILLSQRAYDLLKDLDLLVLPALATLYATLATIWHWQYATEVVATVGAFVVILGVLLKISNVQYKATAKVVVAQAAVVVAQAQVTDPANTPMTPGTFSQ